MRRTMDAYREPSPPRPPGLLYGLEDVPPLGLTLLMGLQHALTVDVAPFVFERLPATLRMLGSSDVAAATIVAIGLNLLLRERTPPG